MMIGRTTARVKPLNRAVAAVEGAWFVCLLGVRGLVPCAGMH